MAASSGFGGFKRIYTIKMKVFSAPFCPNATLVHTFIFRIVFIDHA